MYKIEHIFMEIYKNYKKRILVKNYKKIEKSKSYKKRISV